MPTTVIDFLRLDLPRAGDRRAHTHLGAGQLSRAASRAAQLYYAHPRNLLEDLGAN